MTELLKNINLGLSFFLELAMLAGFGYWGFQGDKSIWLKWVLGIGLPLVVIIIWGLWFAPKAAHRLNATAGIILSGILFLLSVFALYYAHQPVLAIIFFILIIINKILAVIWMQW